MSIAFGCIFILMLLVSLVAIAIAWRIATRMRKIHEAERQIKLCLLAVTLGDKDLWETCRDKALKKIREIP